MTHADAFAVPLRRRPDPLDAQSCHLAGGAVAEHARTGGARHRRLRVRAGADDREQAVQGALPAAAIASVPVVAALNLFQPKSPKPRRTAMIHPSTFLSRALLAD